MGLFNKNKKDSSLHTLSESEIQKRLYGNLKSSDKTSDTVPHKFKTIPTPEFQATPASSKRETASPLSQEAAYATGAKDDLFSQSDEYSDSVDTRDRKSEESDAAEESISLKEAVHEQSIMSRLAEIAENEKSVEKNKAVNNYPSAGASKGATGGYDVLDN